MERELIRQYDDRIAQEARTKKRLKKAKTSLDVKKEFKPNAEKIEEERLRLRDQYRHALPTAQERLAKSLEEIRLRDPGYLLDLMGAREPIKRTKRITSERLEDIDANGLSERD
jgi:hypothetical protein